MNIKHGDIITLDNGDVVKVSLEVIQKKVTELIPNKRYKLKFDKNHWCHSYGYNFNLLDSSEYSKIEGLEKENHIFIGKINIFNVDRYIFISEENIYSTFSCESLDFVVKQID